MLDHCDIPNGVQTYEQLAVWAVARLSRLARGKTVGAGPVGGEVAACSCDRVEGADGRLYARLEVFAPMVRAELNAPGQKTWMSARALVGAADGAPAGVVFPTPGGRFDPLELSPVDLWDATRPETVEVVSGLVAAWHNRVAGRGSLVQADPAKRPAWEADAGDGLGALRSFGGSSRPALSAVSASRPAREVWVVAKLLATTAPGSSYSWLLRGADSLNTYTLRTGTAPSAASNNASSQLYVNGNDSVNRYTTYDTAIRAGCALRMSLNLKTDLAPHTTQVFWANTSANGTSHFHGWVRFVATFEQPLDACDRRRMWDYLMKRLPAVWAP